MLMGNLESVSTGQLWTEIASCAPRHLLVAAQAGLEFVCVFGHDGVHWYNTQRLLGPIGNVAPVEYEMNYYRSQEGSLEMARLN